MDPLFVKWVSIAFAGLLLLAARHKLESPAAFKAVLAEYRLLPRPLLRAAAWTIPTVELLLASAWLATCTAAVAAAVSGVATAALLVVYAGAIAVNLLRGRRFVSCGCAFAGGARDRLSWSLVLRNLSLAALALMAASPAPARELAAGDYALLAAMSVTTAFVYLAASQLARNARSWRHGRG